MNEAHIDADEITEEQQEVDVPASDPLKMTWKSHLTFGKHCGKTFLQVLIQHKDYLKWCHNETLHLTNPEIKWIWDNIKSAERTLIIHGDMSQDKLRG